MPQGATFDETVSIMQEWKTASKELWAILKKEWNERFGVVLGSDDEFFDDAVQRQSHGTDIASPAVVPTQINLISFVAREVVFEICLPTTEEDDL